VEQQPVAVGIGVGHARAHVGEVGVEVGDELGLARSVALHVTYPGRQAIAGNLAFPFSPSDIQSGPVYEFSIYHLIEASDALRFDFHLEQVTPEGVQL